jgi:heme/copper-type cytochrome/quinol oxidase subunit 4
MQAQNLDEKRFRGWRLLAVIFTVVVILAAVSATIDWLVIGPLEGRI